MPLLLALSWPPVSSVSATPPVAVLLVGAPAETLSEAADFADVDFSASGPAALASVAAEAA
ncbi:hypothetical protein [Actinoplanes sp. DH11]|uniref:hypothetical protein n=1 Tax=Actinoplanes sp. DH11 TaxID=2857011 RepID=UPI001E31C08A|nr:hypothetical protein [Actinoplanes sp. DH11]